MYSKLLALVSVCFISACATSTPAPAANTPPTQSESEMASAQQQAILERVNTARAEAGLEALQLNARLNAAAQKHAEKMISSGIFDHEIEGKKVQDRMSAEGYNWRRAGENIAAGQTTAEEVMESWMNSEAHRQNILKADYEELGVGFAIDEDNGNERYWVQVFGTEAN